MGHFAFVTFFITPRHFTGLFGLCNIFVPPWDFTLLVFLAFVTFFVPPGISLYMSFFPLYCFTYAQEI